jgi:glycerophosphoryl diester phosphodiesterase
MPQAIAHRGYKAKFPENTMASFKGAVDIGAHALETDIHLSRDGVVLLSHVCFSYNLTIFNKSFLTSRTGPYSKALLWFAGQDH